MEFKRNSSRSSLRATPLFTTITKRKTNRKTGYDQLESTIDQVSFSTRIYGFFRLGELKMAPLTLIYLG